MKIISGGIQHETNTFADVPTTLADFIRDSHLGADLPGGEAVVERYFNTATIHGGYLAGALEADFSLSPVLNARAYPSGIIQRDAFEHLAGLLIERIQKELPADGLLLDLHGAMVTEDHPDAEAEILRRVRELAGPDFPVIVTLDLHANISEDLARRSTCIIGFDTYPHVDMGDRGLEAARLMNRVVRDGVRPVQAFRQLPLATLPPMQCTLREPMQSFMKYVHDQEEQPGLLTASIAMGFPFADIPDMGVSVLATADNDQVLADRTADDLAQRLWQMRDELQPQLTAIERAMQVSAATDGLTVFADGSDNPGGGAPCDGTVALRALVSAGFEGAVVGVLCDPGTVRAAVHAGAGSTFAAEIGGRTDDRHGSPLHADATVVRVSDGDYQHVGPMAHGLEDSLGPTVLLEVNRVLVVVSTNRRQLLDRSMLATVGLDLDSIRLLVVKSAVHFRADIGREAAVILDGDTPGIHRPDFSCFQYRNVRPGVYPI